MDSTTGGDANDEFARWLAETARAEQAAAQATPPVAPAAPVQPPAAQPPAAAPRPPVRPAARCSASGCSAAGRGAPRCSAAAVPCCVAASRVLRGARRSACCSGDTRLRTAPRRTPGCAVVVPVRRRCPGRTRSQRRTGRGVRHAHRAARRAPAQPAAAPESPTWAPGYTGPQAPAEQPPAQPQYAARRAPDLHPGTGRPGLHAGAGVHAAARRAPPPVQAHLLRLRLLRPSRRRHRHLCTNRPRSGAAHPADAARGAPVHRAGRTGTVRVRCVPACDAGSDTRARRRPVRRTVRSGARR